MIRVLLSLLTIIIALGPLTAIADGNYLLSRCENALKIAENPGKLSSRADMAYCYGLLQGVRELNQLYELKLDQAAYFCLDNQKVGHRESAQLVIDYLEKHPDKLGKNETSLAVQAFRTKYPCN